MSVALALFVKTPGLSPIKTRLAADIGAAAALAIYRASVACVKEAVDAAARQIALTPYWAVAEAEGAADWSPWPVVIQPDADLGERMRVIYDSLWHRHGAVLLVGADAPMLSAGVVADAARELAGPPARVLVPADDGGFVLFGANSDLATDPWSAVPYGAPDTALRFLAQVGPALPLRQWPAQPDLDTQADAKALLSMPPPLPTESQRKLWALLANSKVGLNGVEPIQG